MANNVYQINQAIKAIMINQLGPDYHELTHAFQIERNNGREARLAYAVRPLNASENEDTNAYRNYTLDHDFELILTDTLTRESDSNEAMLVIETMFDHFDEMYRVMVNTKIGLQNLILIVRKCEITEPEFLSNGKIIVLRMKINIKYRVSVP